MKEHKQNVLRGLTVFLSPTFVGWPNPLPSGAFMLNSISRRYIGASVYYESYALALSSSIYIIPKI